VGAVFGVLLFARLLIPSEREILLEDFFDAEA
jgi:hypothetical protein